MCSFLTGARLRNNLGQVIHTSVTNQCNLVLVEGWWRSLAGKVITGLVESNGSLPLGDGLNVNCWLTACRPGSAPGPTLGNECGRTLPYLCYHSVCNYECSLRLPSSNLTTDISVLWLCDSECDKYHTVTVTRLSVTTSVLTHTQQWQIRIIQSTLTGLDMVEKCLPLPTLYDILPVEQDFNIVSCCLLLAANIYTCFVT